MAMTEADPNRGVKRGTPPWVIVGYLGGLVFVFLGERIVSTITHVSVENLGLQVGREAIALVKASSVIVATDDGAPLKLSARNRLDGTVTRLAPGAVNTEVVIELKGANSVAAIITNVAARRLALAVGTRAAAIFKASSVILGVAG